MNPNLNALRIAMLQCLSSPDVTADQVTEVIRETARAEMDAGTDKTKKCRTILEKLRIPYHYTTCPDYLSNPAFQVSSDYIDFNANSGCIDFGDGNVAAQPVTMGADGLVGAYGEDTIVLG